MSSPGEDAAWSIIKATLPLVPKLGKMLLDALDAGHGDEETREKVAELVRSKLPEKSETARALEGLDDT